MIYQRPYLSPCFLAVTHIQEFGYKVCAWVFWRRLDCIWPTCTNTHTTQCVHPCGVAWTVYEQHICQCVTGWQLELPALCPLSSRQETHTHTNTHAHSHTVITSKWAKLANLIVWYCQKSYRHTQMKIKTLRWKILMFLKVEKLLCFNESYVIKLRGTM